MYTILKTRALVLLAGLVVFLLAGCVTTETKSQTPALGNVVQDAFPSGESAKVLLRPGVMFSLQVEVDGVNECEEDGLRVRQDGTAVLPMVGLVALGGLTLSEASDQLVELYSVYYKEKPLIRLQFSEDESGASSPWGYVTVLGRVNNPGRVNLLPTRDLTVSGAIQGADGFDTSANLKAVRISRSDTSGKKRQITVNMERIGERGTAIEDVKLKNGDVVYVPETIF